MSTAQASVRSFVNRCRARGPGQPSPRQSRLEVWIGAGVLAAVAWPKLFWWDDPVTLLVGIGAAALLAAVSGWAASPT
ncbi:MAG TPA: hypothetical protein VN493_15925 [Thermoanaerobaculia bacterium]|nr:hypothetical protein [Thermoanaerobaculia bacterium]